MYVFFLVMTSKKQNSISFWYSLQIQGGEGGNDVCPALDCHYFSSKARGHNINCQGRGFSLLWPLQPPPPACPRSFRIKVTVSIFKLVKVPAILNTKFRSDGSMVGGGGQRRGETGARNPKRATQSINQSINFI